MAVPSQLFGNAFQGGPHFEIFTAQGTNPVADWKLSPNNTVKKLFDKNLKGNVFVVDGTNAFMQIPKDEKKSMSLVQQYLVFQLFVPHGKGFQLELSIIDIQNNKRRIHLSTTFKELSVTPLHAKIPLNNIKRECWLNFSLDLWDLVSFCFKGQTFARLELILIRSNCSLRKIFTMKSPLADMSDLDSVGVDLPKNYAYPLGVDYEFQHLDLRELVVTSVDKTEEVVPSSAKNSKPPSRTTTAAVAKSTVSKLSLPKTAEVPPPSSKMEIRKNAFEEKQRTFSNPNPPIVSVNLHFKEEKLDGSGTIRYSQSVDDEQDQEFYSDNSDNEIPNALHASDSNLLEQVESSLQKLKLESTEKPRTPTTISSLLMSVRQSSEKEFRGSASTNSPRNSHDEEDDKVLMDDEHSLPSNPSGNSVGGGLPLTPIETRPISWSPKAKQVISSASTEMNYYSHSTRPRQSRESPIPTPSTSPRVVRTLKKDSEGIPRSSSINPERERIHVNGREIEISTEIGRFSATMDGEISPEENDSNSPLDFADSDSDLEDTKPLTLSPSSKTNSKPFRASSFPVHSQDLPASVDLDDDF